MENDNKSTKDAVLFIKVSEDEKAEIHSIVAQQGGDMNVSRFVRESIREKIAGIKQMSSNAEIPQ